MTVNNEIYFGIDPATGLGVNLNFAQPTRRTGAELQANWRIFAPLVIRASAGYVSAQFAGSSGYLPLVPRVTAKRGNPVVAARLVAMVVLGALCGQALRWQRLHQHAVP